MNNFNFVNQFNKKSILFIVLVSMSLTYFFSHSISLDEENNLIKDSYGIIQKFPVEIDYAHFISSVNQDNQVKVFLKSLTTNDTTESNNNNQSMNAVMKVYSTNGTLLKTTSFPSGFNYNGSESVKLATNIADKSIETVTAVIQLTNLEKTQPLSDPITIKLGLGQVTDK
ncbi:MAG: hypothetical protein K0S93_431 [Nitrososphaeraceae archaeon]|jgi:hypothetical protein|nr:hypothetical protein [Nitrososphaeraceae archaeon]